MRLRRLWLLIILLALAAPARAGECRAPQPVCALAAAVYTVSAADPLASAVRIGEDLLVTNRHVVADRTAAEVFLPDGGWQTAAVLPTAYPGDLVLLRLEGLAPGPQALPAANPPERELYSIGADPDLQRIEVYPPGEVLLLPAAEKPLARLHHAAYSRPGNSGGALADAAGRLVGIVTSGGSGHFEAIPAAEIARLRAMSGPEHAAASQALGRAYRDCQVALDRLAAERRPPAEELSRSVAETCLATGNRQLYDDAGRALGQAGRVADSIALFEASLAEDPNAVNARLSLVVSLHIARRYAAELPHLAWLLEVTPADPQVLRFAVQAGKWGGDPDLAERALALLEAHHPQIAPVARRFYESDQPAPQ